MSQEYAIVALDQGRHSTPTAEQADEPAPSDAPGMGLLLHYSLPDELAGKVEPGHMVVVPLRGKPAYGVVLELADSSPVGYALPVKRLVDPRPVLPAYMLGLARWIAAYYRCTLWQALAPMLPPGVARRAVTTLNLTDGALEDSDRHNPLIQALGRKQRQVVSLLQSAPKSSLSMGKLRRKYSGAPSGLNTAVLDLERKGLLSRRTELPAPRSSPQHERIIRLAVSPDAASEALRDTERRAPLQAAALDWLLKRTRQTGGAQANEAPWLPLSDLYLHTGATSSTVTALERKGWVELSRRAVYRKPVPPTAATPNDAAPALTSAQAAAWREIALALRAAHSSDPPAAQAESLLSEHGPPATTGDGNSGESDVWEDPGAPSSLRSGQSAGQEPRTPRFLLHGVTGSGKTEVYLRAIGMTLRLGKQAIVLVPEISLTPQAVHRFAARFPGRVALIHSRLSPGQQFDEWRRIREGHANIVVGSRSAVFAPLPRLGIIIVDEEHEWAYKQSERQPHYHAREVALKRAELCGATVILGSATPDLASYYHAQRGDYTLLSLPHRVGRRKTREGVELSTELPMPQVQVVDMRAELRGSNNSLFSRALQSALEATLGRKEQAILYLNRRGSNSFLLCRECGHVPLCPRCDVPLVYHAAIHGMLCHRCNAFSLAPRECPKCGSSQIKGFGTGTQKVVDEVATLFPGARVLRWDRDTAARQGSHSDLMDIFSRGEADVLVGTQMIAKGLDIDRVTLVGVISADTGLFLPDFRAPERAVQLLMQVAGRAGRRTETTHSRVIVQTFNPDHYAVQAAAQYDYRGFYKGEIRFRAEHGYPPYGQLARLVYTSPNDERCEREAETLARYLRRKLDMLREANPNLPSSDADLLGPAPCFVHKVNGRYRRQILLRGSDLAPLLEGFHPGSGWSLDIDPMSLL